LNPDTNQTGKGLKRYYWSAFAIGGMVAGFLGCIVYAHITKGEHRLFSDASSNPKTDKPIVQTALTAVEVVSQSAFLGVEIMSVDAVITQQLSLPIDCGVLVTSVIDGFPAQKVGLQRGDVILSLNNIAVKDVDGFRKIMAELNPGDDARIIYVRGGQKDIAYATLANSSAVLEPAQEPGDSDWGVSLSVLSSDLRSLLRIPADIDGIVILSVTPDGLADEVGLQSGDVIISINNTPIADMSDFFKALSSDKDGTALLDVYSQGALRYVALDSTGPIKSVAQTRNTLLDRILSVFTDDNKVILVEHTNEEDDYEKPVCKRLEESGERYDVED
jgi:membrane-associated protease RseP (regulator of RpoE activity)